MSDDSLLDQLKSTMERLTTRTMIRLRLFPDLYKLTLSFMLWGLTAFLLLRVPTTGEAIVSVPHAIYAALQLAGLNATGVPIHGGGLTLLTLQTWALWACYFLVPGTVLAALADLVFRAFSRPGTLTRACDGQTVILGMGGHGTAVLQLLLKPDKRGNGPSITPAVHPWDVVTVDQHNHTHGLHEDEHGHHWMAVRGDILDSETLTEAAIQRAHRVIVCTGNAALNAMAAMTVSELNPDLGDRLVVLGDDERAIDRIYPNKTWKLVQQFETAAQKMWDEVWTSHQHRRPVTQADSPPPISLSILGMGRFGRALLHQLPHSALPHVTFEAVHLVDARPLQLEPGTVQALARELPWAHGVASVQTHRCDGRRYISDLTTGQRDDGITGVPDNHILVVAIDNDVQALQCLEWLECAKSGNVAPTDTSMLVALRVARARNTKTTTDSDVAVFSVLNAFQDTIRGELTKT